jgi:hypothetical protein
VLAAWLFFDRKNGIGLSNDIGLSLAMISVLLFVAVMIPWLLSLVWKKHRVPHQSHPQEIPFQDWRTGDVAVWGAKLRGTHAAIDVLLAACSRRFRSHRDRNRISGLRRNPALAVADLLHLQRSAGGSEMPALPAIRVETIASPRLRPSGGAVMRIGSTKRPLRKIPEQSLEEQRLQDDPTRRAATIRNQKIGRTRLFRRCGIISRWLRT